MNTRSLPAASDEDLIHLVKEGNPKAGDVLVRRHQRLVAKAVYDVVRDLGAVEDLIQEIFLRAFRKSHLFNPKQGRFTVWLTTVARREAISHLRRRKRSRLVSLDQTSPEGGLSPGERPSQQVSKRETWTKVVEAIQKLSEPARTILLKRIIESKPFDQIARLVRQPVDTVKTTYYRNTEALRKKLGIPGL